MGKNWYCANFFWRTPPPHGMDSEGLLRLWCRMSAPSIISNRTCRKKSPCACGRFNLKTSSTSVACYATHAKSTERVRQGNANWKKQFNVKSSEWQKMHLWRDHERGSPSSLNREACAWSASGMYQLSRKEENFTGKLDLLADSFPTFPFRFYLRRSHQRWAPQVNKSFFFFFFFSFFFSFISHPQISDFGLSNTNWTLLSKTLPTGCCLVRLNQLAVA